MSYCVLSHISGQSMYMGEWVFIKHKGILIQDGALCYFVNFLLFLWLFMHFSTNLRWKMSRHPEIIDTNSCNCKTTHIFIESDLKCSFLHENNKTVTIQERCKFDDVKTFLMILSHKCSSCDPDNRVSGCNPQKRYLRYFFQIFREFLMNFTN